jgi:hypothetical protein
MRLPERLTRRKGSTRHPTPQQAYDALSEGFCMYARVSTCSGEPFAAGLRDDWDVERALRKAFSRGWAL